ncbi:hypothetical protein B0T25DRAFT_570831 [Lasiosphaeria hispida]|uniref:Uncharacterized protein n=1 Tax=Lasiosphaeria hispida TaxID=260671 RepID=A0AAJ0HGB2_9PEZI|nr:hypothetical protein B0T25DRAFT_570831 [Lasiosphaeria hispida]
MPAFPPRDGLRVPSQIHTRSNSEVDSFGGETYHGKSSRNSFDVLPEVFQDLEKSRSITSLTALTPNRAQFAHNNTDEDQPPKPDTEKIDAYSPTRPILGIKARLAHFTWAWYTLPHQFPGLRQIGFAMYIINIILLTSSPQPCSPASSSSPAQPITHPREGFFFPTFFLSIATLITSTQQYTVPTNPADASPGLLWATQTAFWIYLALTTLVAVGQYSFVFTAHSHGLQTMIPT